jgi:hypothetical protein
MPIRIMSLRCNFSVTAFHVTPQPPNASSTVWAVLGKWFALKDTFEANSELSVASTHHLYVVLLADRFQHGQDIHGLLKGHPQQYVTMMHRSQSLVMLFSFIAVFVVGQIGTVKSSG